MSAVEVSLLPQGQQEALEALHSIARASDGALTVDLDYEQMRGSLNVRVYLSSASLLSSEQGAVLEDWEPIDIAIPENFPYRPPIASAGRTTSRICPIRLGAPVSAFALRTATGTRWWGSGDSCGRSSTPTST